MEKLTARRRKKLRKGLELDRQQMAQLFGVGTAAVRRWETMEVNLGEPHQRLFYALNTLQAEGKLSQSIEIAKQMQYGSEAFVSLVFREVYLERNHLEPPLFTEPI